MASSTSLTHVNSSLFDETERISPRVLGVERSLAPRADDDTTCRCLVHVLARETVQRLRTIERGFQVLDREGQRLCRRVWLTLRGDIQHLQGHRAAIEVASAPHLFPALHAEQIRIEHDRRVEITDFDDESEELRYIIRRCASCGHRPDAP